MIYWPSICKLRLKNSEPGMSGGILNMSVVKTSNYMNKKLSEYLQISAI